MNSPARSLANCMMCGAPALDDSPCSFCGSALNVLPGEHVQLQRSVPDVVREWARKVRWAPRSMTDLVTAVAVRDEIIERTALELVSRTVREERAPCRGRPLSGPRFDPSGIDLFSTSLADLRTSTEHAVHCSGCNGSALVRCRGCHGQGRSACASCGGSGKTLKHYKKSSRLIQCKVCKASGTVRCGACGGDGSVNCATCIGSGQELVWLTFDQQTKWLVAFEPMSPIVSAHPVLRDERFLDPSELDEFGVTTLEQTSADEVPSGDRLRTNQVRGAALSIDPRRERVRQRQHLRLAIIRRDVTYELCGVVGTLVLSGKNLLVATNREALGPIRRRRLLWVVISVIWIIVTSAIASRLEGHSPFFASLNAWLSAVWFFAVAFALPAIGAGLRAFRRGFRLGKLTATEKVCGFAAAAAMLSLPCLRLALEPRITELIEATARGDTAEAHRLLDALREVAPSSRELDEADDSLRMFDARAAARPVRIALLDSVARRGGTQAEPAKSLARQERLAEVRELRASSQPLHAVAAIDRWFREAWSSDPELRKERASAFDRAQAACEDELCSFQMSIAANATDSGVERDAREKASREALLAALHPPAPAGEVIVDRLRRYRRAAELGQRVLADLGGKHQELAARAEQARERSREERRTTAILGSALPVAEELMQVSATSDSRATWLPLDTVNLYLALDAQKAIRGVYIVGSSPSARVIHGSPSADELLSQSLGRAVAVKQPTGDASRVQSYEAGVRVVTRWKLGQLVELRIGSADP